MAEKDKKKDKEKDVEREEASSDNGSSLPSYGLAEEILGKASSEDGPDETKDLRTKGGNGASADENLMKFVTFFLDKEEYGLPISQVQEINRVVEITRVPNCPEHVIGVINLRGKIVPVIELKSRLKIGATDVTKDSRIVVVEHGPKILGLMVDSVAQVLNIASEQIEDAPEEVVKVDENYIKGVGKIDDRMVILLELEKVVGKVEVS